MPIDLATTPVEDAVEQIVVAACDTRAALVALTGRASRNVIPWGDYGQATLPVVAFLCSAIEEIGPRTYRCTLAVAGFADPTQESRCRAMVAAVVAGLESSPLAAIAGPLGPIDGVPGRPVRQRVVDEPREGEPPPPARADVTLVLTLWL